MSPGLLTHTPPMSKRRTLGFSSGIFAGRNLRLGTGNDDDSSENQRSSLAVKSVLLFDDDTQV